MTLFMFLQNYSGFWLENGLTGTGWWQWHGEIQGVTTVQTRGKAGVDQGWRGCGEYWRDARYALEK